MISEKTGMSVTSYVATKNIHTWNEMCSKMQFLPGIVRFIVHNQKTKDYSILRERADDAVFIL